MHFGHPPGKKAACQVGLALQTPAWAAGGGRLLASLAGFLATAWAPHTAGQPHWDPGPVEGRSRWDDCAQVLLPGNLLPSELIILFPSF